MEAVPAPAPVVVLPVAATAAPTFTASADPEAQAIDKAEYIEGGQADAKQTRRLTLKLQVLLDRAHIGPGVIDGRPGENLRQAVAAYERAHNLPEDGKLDAEVWTALTADARPAMQDYTISDADVAGPFVEKIPTDYAEMAKLKSLAYTTPLELLAEKFHMDQALLKALNPDADFTKAGTTLVVAAPGDGALSGDVDRIEVDKAEREVRAFDAAGRLLAVYPATVGSSEMPTPEGEWEVTSVTHDPVWNYDPAKLNFGNKKLGKLTIPAGPNNPVGVVWIDLSKDTYGIHGAPEPQMVGKVASHGCVRLTNWDAEALGRATKKGAKVVFVGVQTAKGKKASSAT